jgi:hypothetical protein
MAQVGCEGLMFDSDKAATAIGRMWLRLARKLDKLATEKSKDGHIGGAVQAARNAEACYWQATGEGTSVDLKDVVST